MSRECDHDGGLSRRDFLRAALLGGGIAALGPVGQGLLSGASAAPGSQTMMTVINLYGGNDGLNTVVPVNLANYHASRPTVGLDPIADNLIPLSSDSMLHYALPNLGQIWNEGSLAIVQKVGYPEANLSHFLSQDVWSYGVRGDFSGLPVGRSGWISRFADLHASTPTGAVSVYGGLPLDFTGGSTRSLQVASLSRFQANEETLYRDNHLHRIETIRAALSGVSRSGLEKEVSDAIGQAQDMASLVEQAVASYNDPGYWPSPSTNISRHLRDIAILTEAGFDTRIFFTGLGGFDTHSGQLPAHETLLQRLDDALGAYVQNLKDMGIWDQVAIVIVTEFGRRNYDNGSAGTDHAHTNALMVLGGAVNGGIYGPDWTDADFEPLVGTTRNPRRYPEYEVDFRDVYREILADHLGVDPAPVFPENQEKNNTLGII
jgi:uncharacterized protein (DUF1501 family)